VRPRWRIENNLRWCREVAFGEGQRRVRVDNAAQNFALPRRIVMSLLRQDSITRT
jgi:predicted transposase YbfD/YdcC